VALPHQGLTINGWADQVAAKAFIEALNSHSQQVWADGRARRAAILISPHDPAWSARVIRERAAAPQFAAVALPLAAVLMGTELFDPIYAAAVETNLPLVVHFSGVEGRYLGAPPLAGGVHRTAFARAAVMPQLAESHIASLCFGGTLAKFPGLRVLFSGFGFSWLPSLAWRLDREWRTFRHDVPWVHRPPSEYVYEQIWLSSWPVREAAADWEPLLAGSKAQARIVYGSHDPIDGDTVDDVRAVLGSSAGGVLGRTGILPAAMTGVSA
jgi:predicted TIM-barrel fold metal-dependent hydrolase